MGSGQVWSDPTQVVDGVLRMIGGVTLTVTGGGDASRVQGCIQSVSESGMRTGMHRNTAEQSKKY